MNTLATGLSYIDLQFQGLPRVIATGVLHGPSGVALVDPGPTTALPELKAGLDRSGISITDVTAVLLTHIHLDHAGVSGTLVHDIPGLRVYVHANGAPHLVDPSKLISSASRLYGDQMDRLWGELRPVAPEALVVLQGGERIEVAGHHVDVAYAPGHASHHVSYFSEETGVAFVGDTFGIRIPPAGDVVPATPPPDVDLEAWQETLRRIGAWRPSGAFLTHFGLWNDVESHVGQFQERLELASRLARASLGRDETDDKRERWFVAEMLRALDGSVDGSAAATYESASRLDLCWRGLARYWRKRGL
jgi:glyoxylase-like metal-dependent hydrolase (beta-lactamase superfamily II)